MRIAVSGAAGRMGRLVVETVTAAPDLELAALIDPVPGQIAGTSISSDRVAAGTADVVVEFTEPGAVMSNLRYWRSLGLHAVVGTSGFTEDRIAELRETWGEGPPNCLVAPNFSFGAVLMMRFAELAAPHFQAAEIIELHHDRKADAPSGTAVNTAERIGKANSNQERNTKSQELVAGARGAEIANVPVHAVRLPGLLAHQEVLLGSEGEVLSIRHDTTDRVSFMAGVLLAIRNIENLPGVTVGIEGLLGI